MPKSKIPLEDPTEITVEPGSEWVEKEDSTRVVSVDRVAYPPRDGRAPELWVYYHDGHSNQDRDDEIDRPEYETRISEFVQNFKSLGIITPQAGRTLLLVKSAKLDVNKEITVTEEEYQLLLSKKPKSKFLQLRHKLMTQAAELNVKVSPDGGDDFDLDWMDQVVWDQSDGTADEPLIDSESI